MALPQNVLLKLGAKDLWSTEWGLHKCAQCTVGLGAWWGLFLTLAASRGRCANERKRSERQHADGHKSNRTCWRMQLYL
eukprot:3984898-Amphidinium_carterae.1